MLKVYIKANMCLLLFSFLGLHWTHSQRACSSIPELFPGHNNESPHLEMGNLSWTGLGVYFCFLGKESISSCFRHILSEDEKKPSFFTAAPFTILQLQSQPRYPSVDGWMRRENALQMHTVESCSTIKWGTYNTYRKRKTLRSY